MLEKTLEKIARFQKQHPMFIILIALVFTGFMAYHGIQIKTDSSFDTMYGDETNTIILGDLVQNEFGSTDTLYVLVTIDEGSNEPAGIRDIRDPLVLQSMVILSENLKTEPSVAQVQSVVDVFMQFYGRLPTTLEESKQMINDLPISTESFLSDDFTAFNMGIDINVGKNPGALEKIQDVVNEKIEAAPRPTGVDFIMTGQPALLNRIMNLLINDNVKTVGIAIIGVFFILWFYFCSYRIAAVSVVPVILTIIWLAGTLKLMDIHITMMIASVGAMMVGLGVDYSIHLTHTFHQNVQKGKRNVTETSVKSTGSALMASALTTIAGFLAMLLGETPSSIIQGKVLAIGVTYALLTTIIVLPCVLVVQRKFLYSPLDEVIFRIVGRKGRRKKEPLIPRMLSKLGGIQTKAPYAVMGGVILLTLVILPGFSLVYLDTENENWLPEEDDVLEALDEVSNKFGGLETQNFLIRFQDDYIPSDVDPINDLRDPRVLNRLSMVEESLLELSFVDGMRSPVQLIKQYNDGRIPQELELVKEMTREYPDIASFFNKDYTLIKVTATSDGFEEEEYFEMLREFDSVSFPEEVEYVPQGNNAEFVELDIELARDTSKTTLLGFLFVIIIASLFYRSLVVGLLAFFPIIFAILWTVGMMGYIDLPFTVLTSGMLAILMGIGIDFSIHIIHKTKELQREGKTIQEAVSGALLTTGEAISISSFTTVCGFLTLTLASLLATRRLGMTLGLGIACTFISCMTIVPAILTIEDRIKNKKREKNVTKVIT